MCTACKLCWHKCSMDTDRYLGRPCTGVRLHPALLVDAVLRAQGSRGMEVVENTNHNSSRWCSPLYFGRLHQAPICGTYLLPIWVGRYWKWPLPSPYFFPICVPQSRCIPRRPSNHRAKITARLRIIAAEGIWTAAKINVSPTDGSRLRSMQACCSALISGPFSRTRMLSAAQGSKSHAPRPTQNLSSPALPSSSCHPLSRWCPMSTQV